MSLAIGGMRPSENPKRFNMWERPIPRGRHEMKKVSFAIRSIWMIFSICAAMESSVFAGQCLDPSPTLSAGKKLSDTLSIRELTNTEHRHAKALLKSLNGKWKGDATEVKCKLANIDDQEVSHYTIKAKAKSYRSGNLLLEAKFYSPEERTLHQKTLRFYLIDKKYLRIHHDSGLGDVELLEVSENIIELRYRMRVKNRGNPGGIYNEFFYRLAAGSDGFSTTREIYTQGKLSSRDEWRFRRQ